MRPAPACLALLLLAACRPAPEAAPEPSGAGTATAPVAPDVVEFRFRCGDLLAGARFDNARSELVLTVATELPLRHHHVTHGLHDHQPAAQLAGGAEDEPAPAPPSMG